MTNLSRKSVRGVVFASALLLSFGAGQAALAAEDCVRPSGGTAHPVRVIPFDLNSAQINETSQGQLTDIANRFKGNKSLDICVIGRADRSGDAGYNKELAMKRANAVADFLKQSGLDSSKYQIISAGQPYSDESWIGKLLGSDQKEGDRRVDVIVMER